MNRLLLLGLTVLPLLLPSTAQALPNVAVYGGTDGVDATAHIANELSATGHFASVTILDGTESQATLSGFHSILFYTNVGGDVNFADKMTSYVQGGGSLVAATFLWQADAMGGVNALGTLAPLLPFTGYNGNYITQVTSVAVLPDDPLLQGVGTLSAFYHDQTNLAPGARLIASWSDGSPLAAVDGDGVIGINLFPNDAYGYVSGNYVQLFDNALTLGRSEVPEPTSAAILAAALAGFITVRRRTRGHRPRAAG